MSSRPCCSCSKELIYGKKCSNCCGRGDDIERAQMDVLHLEAGLLRLPPGNENQPFLCVLVLIFVEELVGINYL